MPNGVILSMSVDVGTHGRVIIGFSLKAFQSGMVFLDYSIFIDDGAFFVLRPESAVRRGPCPFVKYNRYPMMDLF
jgi:hypothetical protein